MAEHLPYNGNAIQFLQNITCNVDVNRGGKYGGIYVYTFTLLSCNQQCAMHGDSFAGIWAGGLCYCENDDVVTSGASTGCCNRVYESNGQGYCGGDFDISAYFVGESSLHYLGCYKDAMDCDLPTQIAGVHSIDACVQNCGQAGYLFAGLQAAQECW
jgi:hypothetical protein